MTAATKPAMLKPTAQKPATKPTANAPQQKPQQKALEAKPKFSNFNFNKPQSEPMKINKGATIKLKDNAVDDSEFERF